ncbi:MAG: 1,4-beta-xylanase [Pseudopedobacter saltans]|uniref:1,4-beta-xylanase n=1 Tax=Pseudopedobacter saltans TaxID=151895 RepID=A0A2W5GNN4_9SPHI|nr:MAG: 1,4-beta-xylanase [Pseudopedobacter saltans]
MKLTNRLLAALLLLFCCQKNFAQNTNTVWSVEKANKWYQQYQWLSGADYIPYNAINQLEMWQKETYSPDIIDKEFALAESIGFNTMRVFLHSLVWKEDAKGFKKRIDNFLSIASKHRIKPMFVFFDDCWNDNPKLGKQPDPKPGIHNSGWAQDPSQKKASDSSDFPFLEKYVKDILNSFGKDNRILAWDLYNEPGNSHKGNNSKPLLVAVFKWAREAGPSQPITAGLWDWTLEDLNTFQVQNSDIITYHDYMDSISHLKVVQILKSFGKPLICTEYMARRNNSLFKTIMPMLKKENVGAINWGFVSGKTNTKYAWDTPLKDGSEPTLWFHDIFREDYTPYKLEEVETIKKLNGKL